MSTERRQELGDALVALDRYDSLWAFWPNGEWAPAVQGERPDWLADARPPGPLTPLVPAKPRDNVPEDAVPFAGWIAWSRRYDDLAHMFTPNGTHLTDCDERHLRNFGLPVPPKPEPTLAERTRREADLFHEAIRSGDNERIRRMQAVVIRQLREAADELENRSSA